MKYQIIKEKLEGYIDEGIIHGVAFSFVNKQIIEKYCLGVNGDEKKPIKITDILYFDIASLTKVIGTTTRIMQLLDEKVITLERKISEFVPGLKFQDITIKDLLLHSSGLSADLQDKENLTKENVIERINRTVLQDELIYSDLGFILLGFIIEKIDGVSLEDSFQKHIFKKINMKSTSYKLQGNVENYIPTEIQESRGCIQGIVHDSKAYQIGMIGSAGLFSTLHDVSLFAQSVLKDELILTEESKQLLLKTMYNQRTIGWDKKFGNNVLYHTGFTGTSICLDFKKEEGFILLTNRTFPKRKDDFLEIRNELVQLFLEENEEIK
ncbi:MAG: serine hydrolase domain-containing protein [Anaerorhabdus sp.]